MRILKMWACANAVRYSIGCIPHDIEIKR